MTGKDHALKRLSFALRHITRLNGFDQEEIDHLNEVYRIIDEDVPAEYFDGFWAAEASDALHLKQKMEDREAALAEKERVA